MYLAEELARNGHEVHVLHSIDAYRAKRKNNFAAETKESDVCIHSVKSLLSQKEPVLAYLFGYSPAVSKKFLQILKTHKPDVVHHHNISLLGYKILTKPQNFLSLYTAHDYWLVCQTNNLMRSNGTICFHKQCYSCAIKWRRFPQIWRRFPGFQKAIKNIDLLISPSEYVQKRLLLELNMKSCVLPNFAPEPPDNIPSSGFSNYFLFVGGLESHKGILNLLNLFNELKDALKTKLIIVGAGSLEKRIRDYIENNSLGQKVILLGFVDQNTLYSLYSNALALIIPSIWPENAPLVALESFSAGTPVIASRNGGLPAIVEKLDNKLIFNSYGELKDLLLNFSKSEYCSNRIKHIYMKNYSPQAYASKYIEVISKFN
jgi:glycosyltransferase involved in cell wall biosynthesis